MIHTHYSYGDNMLIPGIGNRFINEHYDTHIIVIVSTLHLNITWTIALKMLIPGIENRFITS